MVCIANPCLKVAAVDGECKFPMGDAVTGCKQAAVLCRYTVLFAVARTVGWVAQWKEMAEEPIQKISRPRQVNVYSVPQQQSAH